MASPGSGAPPAQKRTAGEANGRTMVFGCSKCRYAGTGCRQCRSPTFKGARGPRVRYVIMAYLFLIPINLEIFVCDMRLAHSSLLNARAPERAARGPSCSPASRFRWVRARNPGTSRNPERPPPPVRLPRERSSGGIVVVSDESTLVLRRRRAARVNATDSRRARPPHAASSSGMMGGAHTPGKRTRLTHPRPPTPRQSRPRGDPDPRRTLTQTWTRPRETQCSKSARWRPSATSRSRNASAPVIEGERAALNSVFDAERTCARRDFSWRSSRSRCRARRWREPSNTRSSRTAPRSRARRRRR